MAIHTIDLLHPVFSQTFMGYASSEVDEFLKEIAEAISSLSADKTNLSAKVAELETRLQECEAEKQKALQALSDQEGWSNKKVEAAKTRIRQEATLIINEAQAKAENILQQGNQRLYRTMNEIAEAEATKKKFKEQLNTLQEDILDWLKKTDPSPAGSLKKQKAAGQAVKKTATENNAQAKIDA